MQNLLKLSGAVGRGQTNDEDDVEALDSALRDIGIYNPRWSIRKSRSATRLNRWLTRLSNFKNKMGSK